MKTINNYINERLVLSKNKVKNVPFDSIEPSERDKMRTFDNLWSMLHYWNRMYDHLHLECVYGEDIEDFPIIYTTVDGDCYVTELYVDGRKDTIRCTVYCKPTNRFSSAAITSIHVLADLLGKKDRNKGYAVITFIEDYMRKNK
jgi:hypothetical protein